MGPELMNDEFISGIVLLQKQHQLESENRGKKMAKPGSIIHHLKKALTPNVAFPSRPKNIKQKHAVYCDCRKQPTQSGYSPLEGSHKPPVTARAFLSNQN